MGVGLSVYGIVMTIKYLVEVLCIRWYTLGNAKPSRLLKNKYGGQLCTKTTILGIHLVDS